MTEDFPSRTLDKIVIRAPDGLRDRLKDAASESGRSMNSEVVTRLEQSLNGYFLDLSADGFVAIVKRLEATVEASDALFFSLRDDLPGIEAVMLDRGVSRTEAIRFIVTDWLSKNLVAMPEAVERPTPISRPQRALDL